MLQRKIQRKQRLEANPIMNALYFNPRVFMLEQNIITKLVFSDEIKEIKSLSFSKI